MAKKDETKPAEEIKTDEILTSPVDDLPNEPDDTPPVEEAQETLTSEASGTLEPTLFGVANAS